MGICGHTRRVHYVAVRAGLIACIGCGLAQPVSAGHDIQAVVCVTPTDASPAASIDGTIECPGMAPSSGANEYVAMAAKRQVRSRNAAIARIILEANELSKTFRNLVDIINTSHVTVYVEEGRCGGSVRACLVTVTPAGPGHRILHVRVDLRKTDADLVGSIGHELYHATEVLAYPSVTTGAAMLSLYRRIGYAIPGGAFETNDAIEAGDAVREEMRAACATPAIRLDNLWILRAPYVCSRSATSRVSGEREATIVAQVDNYAEVPPADLAEAESAAADIYESIGVRVIWVHADVPFDDPRGVRVHVRLLSRKMADRKVAKEKTTSDVLGEAIAAARCAYVFVDRIPPVVFQFGQPFTRVLGLVIAHEIGHILLPGQGHAESGIMSAHVNLWSRKLVYFTPEQGTEIKSLLMRLAAQ